MRKFLKRVLSQSQYRRLAERKRRITSAYQRFKAVMMNRLLTEKFRVQLKSHLNVVKRLDYAKEDIYLNIDSDIEYRIRTHSCAKEPEMIDWIENVFKEGDVFFDIGANVGAYSLVAAKFWKGRVQVFSFEPGFMNFPKLCKNIFINRCQETITPLQVALSDVTRIDTFHYQNLTPGGALHAFGAAIDWKGEAFQPVFRQPVIAFRIDDLIHQWSLPVPHHIKMDVDGFEFQILKGASKTLQSSDMKSIFIEIEEGGQEEKDITGYLKSYGFHFHSKHKYTLPEDTGPFSKMYNYIFIRT